MKKGKKLNNQLILIFVIVFIILVTFFFIYKNNSKFNSITSKELDLSIIVPPHYEVTQKFHTLSIINKKGEITVNTYGSFFDNLDEHISDLSKKNNVRIEILEKIPSDKYQIYKVKFDKGTRTKPEDISYLILTKNYAIYSFQANSEALYSDLDAIAKSFRYNP